MYTSDALIDVHERTHRSLQKLLDHCAGFSDEASGCELDGFSYPSLRQQLRHMIGAEAYWLGVLRGLMLVDERDEDCASIDALRAYREQVAETTATYLRETTDQALRARRTMTTWGDKQVELVPAHVVLRTQTHIYQHQGEIAVMARQLGRPIPRGLDFPMV